MGRWLMSTCVGMLRGLVVSIVLGLCVLVEVRLVAVERLFNCFKLRINGSTSG
jgi:hypothetical protein